MNKGRAITAAVCALLCAGAAALPAGAAAKPVARTSIIAGGPADITGFPYMAAILRKNKMHCGGAVIAPTKILTAAHCVAGFNPAGLIVVTGRTRLFDRVRGQEIGVAAAVTHPDYQTTQLHDIGVITLASPTSAEPIDLPTPEQVATLGLAGQLMHVAGWGAKNPFGFNLSKVLKQTTEQIRTDRRCRKAYHRLYNPVSMICALGAKLKRFGRPFIHTTACSGDSGGPLIADTAMGPVAIGTVSFGGAFCGLGAAPTVYSRVSDSLGFIQGA